MQGVKVYINFGDSRFQELGPECFQEIEEIAADVYLKGNENEAENVYYFLDEIQNFPGWENWVDRLNREGAGVFVTSSSSSLLNKDIASRFAGRTRFLKLLPFSFKEYLTLKGLRVPKPNFLTPSRCDEMLCLFLKYFENGGFPAVIKDGNFLLSGEYFEEILNNGVISRYNVQDAEGLKKLAIFLISNMASEYAIDTLKRASGIESEDTVRAYLDYLEEAFLLYRTPLLNPVSENEKETNQEKKVPCKVYAGDTGFFKTVFPNYPDSLGLRFENLVFLELLRRDKQVSYFRDRRECDFLLTEKDCQAVQAAVQVSVYFGTPAVREREVLGLLAAMEEYGLNEGLILTMDDEGVIEIPDEDREKKRIVINSVWKWMLE
ncbi:hypothetical protein MSSAC_1560 [Methanosarcina siciliae C2J]|uniref:ATPase n=1 Tax=Methanosarcina siciliae C2J TaxID=1434118 RepID=A0A0E3PMG7_9EURY|nr:hypothetical protein MSSAC_1560 [Methanosarcina siciliae C2J]